MAPRWTASVLPGGMTVFLARSSWQPPQKRCSPGRPLIQTSSVATDMANLSMSCMCSGTLAGTLAANEPSA
jgi:hypothetical protein